MRTISEIYEEYKISPWLQEHMLRVASVAKIICDSSDIDLDNNHIISACLLHDTGNIIKFDLNKFPEFVEKNGSIEYWQEVQNEFFEKYGRDEHQATMKIGREIGVSEKTLEYIDLMGFDNVEAVDEAGDVNNKICSYSDMRVAPHGIRSLKERLDDGVKRYKDVMDFDPVETDRIHNKLYSFEKEIFSNLSIKPADINNTVAKPIIEELKNYIVL